MKKGFVATTIVLIITAIVIAVTATVTLVSIGEVQTTFSQVRGEETLSLVEGCMEEALLNVRNNAGYTGGNIGTCTVTVNSGTITVSTAGDYVRTIRVTFTRGSSVTLTSWQEI